MVDLQGQSIGATRITAVAGINPYTAPIDVWAEIMGIGTPFTGNEASRLGLQMEPVCAKDYAMKFGYAFNVDDYDYDGLGNNQYVGSKELFSPDGVIMLQPGAKVYHPDVEYFHATPDFLIPNKKGEIVKIVEIKTFGLLSGGRGASEVWGEEGSDEVPAWYFAQVQWQMYIVGPQIKEADLHVMVPGFGKKLFYTYTIKRDDELIDILVKKGHDFWQNHVLAEVAPAADESESYKDFLADRFPKSGELTIDDNGEMERWASQYRDGKKERDAGEAKMREAQNHLKEKIGDNNGIKGRWGFATWKSIKDTHKTDWEKAFGDLSQKVEDARLADQIRDANTVLKKGIRRFVLK